MLAREHDRRDGGRLVDDWPELDLATAYEAQDVLLRKKIDAGERVVGVKLGLTSRAKQERMGVHSPITGWLTDGMVLPAGAPVPPLIHPRVEPEIVFVLGKPLRGPGITGPVALDAVASVHAGFEVIDSRYTDFRFTLPDVVADNASAARFVVGATGVPPTALDLRLEACVLSVQGEPVDSATGAAVQGHPAEALALAANDLGRRGITLEAGWLVLTGGLTDAVPLRPKETVTAEFRHLGTVYIEGG
nr:fumarylacetoacetate hydrolase family protein [Amycolatopsis pithecellobii]